MRRESCLPNMAQHMYHMVSDRHNCAKNGTWLKYNRLFQLFPATKPMEFVAMDILISFSERTKGNEYVVFTTDRFSQLTSNIPTNQTTTTNVAYVIFHNGIIPYRIPTYTLTDSGTQLTSKLFAILCSHLGTKKLTTTLITNIPVGMLNETTKQFWYGFAIVLPIVNATGFYSISH